LPTTLTELTDLHLPTYIESFKRRGCIASFLSAPPNLSYHIVRAAEGGLVQEICEMTKSNLRINSGYFAFRKEIFRYISNGEELVREPFQRLIVEKQLVAYEHPGFFLAMDTFKDRQQMEDLFSRGVAPWEVWKNPAANTTQPARQAVGQVPSQTIRLLLSAMLRLRLGGSSNGCRKILCLGGSLRRYRDRLWRDDFASSRPRIIAWRLPGLYLAPLRPVAGKLCSLLGSF